MEVQVAFYKDEGKWIAHCLNFDLIGDAETKEWALFDLNDTIGLQIEATIKVQNLKNLICPAPKEIAENAEEIITFNLEVVIQMSRPDTINEVSDYPSTEPKLIED